ncbi:MAG: YbaB/EbfC family nucleoid-associated protein [Anaerolineae bacterium]
MDPNALMRQVQKMQQEVEQAQARAEEEVIEVSAGGGVIEVQITGGLQIQSVKIRPEVVDPEDVEMLEDLVMAAMNEAIQKAQARVSERMAEVTGGLNSMLGGLGIPGM